MTSTGLNHRYLVRNLVTPFAVASDSFNRTDSASTMGNTDSAYGGTTATWVPNSGTWGISTNRAALISATSQATTVVETGVADCSIYVTCTVTGDAGTCWRSTDDSNHWLMNNSGQVFKKVAAGFTQVGTFSGGAFSNGAVVAVVLAGSVQTFYVNGAFQLSFTDTFNSTATKHGLRSNNATAARFDDFLVQT